MTLRIRAATLEDFESWDVAWPLNHLGENTEVNFRSFRFSAGETQVRLDPDAIAPHNFVEVIADVLNGDDIMELLLALDAIHRIKGPRDTPRTEDTPGDVNPSFWSLRLLLPYLPYGRQDRACVNGEAFSLHVFSQMLKPYFDTAVDEICTWDAHSPVFDSLSATHSNLTVSSILEGFSRELTGNYVVVAPDKGAMGRASEAATWLGSTYVAHAEKIRNPDDGSITGTVVPDGALCEGQKVLIVDDICDGGRTFIELAKVLRQHNPTSISLYVTHGILSKGFGVFENLIDRFYVANLFPNCYQFGELPSNVSVLRTVSHKVPISPKP